MRRILVLLLAFAVFFSSAAAEIHAVNFNDSCAVIDSDGNRAIDSSGYDMIFVLKNENNDISGYAAGIADENNGVHYALLSPDGERLTDFSYTYIASAGKMFIASCRDDWRLLTSRGDVLGDAYSDMEYIGGDTCFAAVGDPYDEISDKLVIISCEGAATVSEISIQYGLSPFSDGLMALADGNSLLYGYVDSNGEWAIEPAYKYAGTFADGCAIIAGESGYGIIDLAGNEIISPEYDFLARSGAIFCAVKDGTAYLFNSDGQMLHETSLDGASARLTGDYLSITTPDEVRIMDVTGAVIFTCDSTASVESAGKYFIVRKGGWTASRAQLFDLTGQPVSQIWSALVFLEDGMFAYGMRDDNDSLRYGLLSTDSGVLTECRYTSLALIKPGLYVAVTDEGAVLLDASGAEKPIS